jgi:hypothetical protein
MSTFGSGEQQPHKRAKQQLATLFQNTQLPVQIRYCNGNLKPIICVIKQNEYDDVKQECVLSNNGITIRADIALLQDGIVKYLLEVDDTNPVNIEKEEKIQYLRTIFGNFRVFEVWTNYNTNDYQVGGYNVKSITIKREICPF